MTDSSFRWLPFAACVIATLSSSTAARAYCRTNTCDSARGENCSVDKDGCRQGGKPLYWGISPVPFQVDQAGSIKNKIDASAFEKVIADAFDTWSSANCGKGKHPNIAAVSLGQTPNDVVEYVAGQENANLFMFRDDMWMATAPGSALALTTVSYDWHTGEIYDADVEVNGTGGNITNARTSDGADLPSVMTHEMGHFLGLDHSSKKTATMYISYVPGKGDLRRLDVDDMAAVCLIYPPRGSVASSTGPRYVVTSPLTGCTLPRTPNPEPGPFFWGVLSFAGLLVLRRRRA